MNWDYIAGFFDGEGCIGIYHRLRNNLNQRMIVVEASQNTRQVLDVISEFLHKEGIDNRVRIADEKRHLFRIIITKVGAATIFLTKIRQKLIVKKDKAIQTLEYIKSARWRGMLTELDKRKILKLFEKGISIREIARRLDRDRLAVGRYLGDLKLTKRGGTYRYGK